MARVSGHCMSDGWGSSFFGAHSHSIATTGVQCGLMSCRLAFCAHVSGAAWMGSPGRGRVGLRAQAEPATVNTTRRWAN